jgi:hypothetical protein
MAILLCQTRFDGNVPGSIWLHSFVFVSVYSNALVRSKRLSHMLLARFVKSNGLEEFLFQEQEKVLSTWSQV